MPPGSGGFKSGGTSNVRVRAQWNITGHLTVPDSCGIRHGGNVHR